MGRAIRFGLLLSRDEKQTLIRLAESEGGLSRGAMVRNLIRTEARRRGLWPPDDSTQTSAEEAGAAHD